MECHGLKVQEELLIHLSLRGAVEAPEENTTRIVDAEDTPEGFELEIPVEEIPGENRQYGAESYEKIRFALHDSSWFPRPLGILIWSSLHLLLIVSGPFFVFPIVVAGAVISLLLDFIVLSYVPFAILISGVIAFMLMIICIIHDVGEVIRCHALNRQTSLFLRLCIDCINWCSSPSSWSAWWHEMLDVIDFFPVIYDYINLIILKSRLCWRFF